MNTSFMKCRISSASRLGTRTNRTDKDLVRSIEGLCTLDEDRKGLAARLQRHVRYPGQALPQCFSPCTRKARLRRREARFRFCFYQAWCKMSVASLRAEARGGTGEVQ